MNFSPTTVTPDQLQATSLQDVWRIMAPVHHDHRGQLHESFRQTTLDDIGLRENRGRLLRIVQENLVCSGRHVLRGLHYQLRQPQDKLVTCLSGQILDVVVDMRPDSPTCGRHELFMLDGMDGTSLWLPVGCAHGFLVLSEQACVSYKMTDYYAPQFERCIAWNDPLLNIGWPRNIEPVLSSKDAQGSGWKQAMSELI